MSRKNNVGGTDMLVLSLLKDQDMYGYQIVKELEERSDSTFELKEGTLYPVLHMLEDDGCITGYDAEATAGKKRRYYHITEEGTKLLSKKLEEWHAYSTAIGKVIGGASYAG